jgi:hypothetical protein
VRQTDVRPKNCTQIISLIGWYVVGIEPDSYQPIFLLSDGDYSSVYSLQRLLLTPQNLKNYVHNTFLASSIQRNFPLMHYPNSFLFVTYFDKFWIVSGASHIGSVDNARMNGRSKSGLFSLFDNSFQWVHYTIQCWFLLKLIGVNFTIESITLFYGSLESLYWLALVGYVDSFFKYSTSSSL